MSARKQLSDYEADPSKFDLRTHFFDGQGRLVKQNHYTLHVISGDRFFERPVNSGNIWFENNQPAGRIEYIKDSSGNTAKRVLLGEAHKVFTRKLEGDEALQCALQQQQERTAALEAELASIRAEQSAARIARAEAEVKPARAPAEVSQSEPSLSKRKV